jgi:hypothetical protein
MVELRGEIYIGEILIHGDIGAEAFEVTELCFTVPGNEPTRIVGRGMLTGKRVEAVESEDLCRAVYCTHENNNHFLECYSRVFREVMESSYPYRKGEWAYERKD